MALAGKERAEYAWDRLFLACRVPGCVYLYVSAQRAFLLPDCEQSESAWALLLEKLPEDKRIDRR